MGRALDGWLHEEQGALLQRSTQKQFVQTPFLRVAAFGGFLRQEWHAWVGEGWEDLFSKEKLTFEMAGETKVSTAMKAR